MADVPVAPKEEPSPRAAEAGWVPLRRLLAVKRWSGEGIKKKTVFGGQKGFEVMLKGVLLGGLGCFQDLLCVLNVLFGWFLWVFGVVSFICCCGFLKWVHDI